MLGYGRDTPKPKRKLVTSDKCRPKRKREPKAVTAQRLADASRSSWTLEECESMTQEKLAERLREHGLPGRLEVSTEASSAGQSWEKLKAAKVASDEKKAAAAASDSCKPKRKQVVEPKVAMVQRLSDDSRSIRTLEECERMSQEELMNRLRDLGLKQRLRLEPSTEASNVGESWEELKAAKV